MASENIRAVLDIGTTKITVLVGEMDEEGGVYIIGHGISPAEGLRRGVVVDMDKTVKSIRKAIEDAQLVSGTEIDSVAVSISGEHIRSINSHGVIAVSRSDNEITATDVNRAIDAARTVAIPVDREIIHVIPQEYSVDDQSGIKDPIGMSGVRLEVEAHLVTASVTTAKNIYRALERCHLHVDHIVLEALAQSQVLLSESDMEIGVVLLDIGGDITNIAVFHDGAIRHTGVISLGSRNITNDIAIGLRTPLKHAKESKEEKIQKNIAKAELRTINQVMKESSEHISEVTRRVNKLYGHVVTDLSAHNLDKLSKTEKHVKKLNTELDELRNNVFYFIKSLDDSSVKASGFYIHVLDYLQDVMQSIDYISSTSFIHVNNNHNNLKESQIVDLRKIKEELFKLLETIQASFENRSFSNVQLMYSEKEKLFDIITNSLDNQVDRIRTEKSSKRNTTLYFGILLETKDLVRALLSLMILYDKYSRLYKDDCTFHEIDKTNIFG